MNTLDICVIVASNAAQAASFRSLLAERKARGLYPREIEFVVHSDPDGGRVGSGGGTLLSTDSLRGPLSGGSRVLLIHAGGEARRMPTYAPEGKLFAPVAVRSSSLFPPVLLDLQLTLFLRYPWNQGEMVVSSGDVAIDFETEFVPADRGAIYGFAKPSSFAEGSRHGVFKLDRHGLRVADFFQKEPEGFLKENAALEGSRSCALDTGIVGFSPRGVEALLALGEKRLSSGRRMLDALRDGAFTMDLYREILCASVAGSSFEHFLRRLGGKTMATQGELLSIFEALRGLELQAYVVRRPRFLHFGSLAEYPRSCVQLVEDGALPFYAGDEAELRPVMTESVLQFNSHASACVPATGARDIIMEGCERANVDTAAGRNILVGLLDRHVRWSMPAGICLDERCSSHGRFLLVYGIDDTWGVVPSLDDMLYCGIPMPEWLAARGIPPEAVFPGAAGTRSAGWDLYKAMLFLPGADEEFTRGYIEADAVDARWRERFLQGPRNTLGEVSGTESPAERESWRKEIRRRTLRAEILEGRGWLSVPERDFLETFTRADEEALEGISDRTDSDLVRMYRASLLHSLRHGTASRDAVRALSFEYSAAPSSSRRLRCRVKVDQIVWGRCAVRLDLAGGWTDTPPFTLHEGGAVVNLAVNLNDQPPIQVFCRPIEGRYIQIHSIDTGEREDREFRGPW